MKKQFLCGILAICMIVFMLPATTLATTTYNYRLNIQTRNVTNAGTDSNVYAGFVFHDGLQFSSLLDDPGFDDFEKGRNDPYYLATNADEPWMIKQVSLYADGTRLGATWFPGIVEVYMPLINGGLGGNTWLVDFSGEELNGSSAVRDCSGLTARRISSWGGFDDWGSTGDLSSESSVSLVRTWDNLITDQYGTYNPWGYNDAPTLTCTSSDAAITGYTFTTGSVSSPASFDLDYKTVYEQMVSAGIPDVTFTFELKFPERTTKMTDDYTNVHTETITISRSAIPAKLANTAIAAAKALIPASFTAEEGTTSNLLTYLNGLPGMSATGTTLTLESANANVATDGTISYTDSAVTGNVTVKINKTDGTEASQIIAVTVKERADAAIAAAQALIPASFTAVEETTTNLLDYLNGLPGMSATGTTLTIASANANVAADGTISYTNRTVTENVTVKINKAGGAEASQTIAVTVSAHVQKISGDYVLIVNESLTESQQIGTISFDDATPFGSSNVVQSLSVNEDEYQQKQLDFQQSETSSANDIIPLGSSDEMQGLSENADSLPFHTQAVTKTYTIGETKEWVYPLSTKTFTVRGIGEHCVIWMDAAADGKYTTESLSIAIASIINVYENNCYPALQTLGADTKMNYVDGSGKLSIFIQGSSTSPYFSYTDMASPNSTTGIHISASTAPTDFSSYALAIAHEGQHALNASTQNFMSWINEGLSTAIMHDLSYKMKNYQYDNISLPWLRQCAQDIEVKSGAGLAHASTTGNSYIDYSIPYLYLRYLSDQVNSGYKYDSDFFSRLYCVDASASGLTGISKDAYIIEQVLQQYDCFENPDGSHWSFQQSFANFRIAAFKQEAAGIYGFYGDTTVTDNIVGIGGAALYFNAPEKSKKIEPTGAVIVKTRNGSFDIPADAGADIKFIPFNVAGQLPANKLNTWFAGGEITQTIYKDRPITFDNLRVVWLHTDGTYGQVYKGLSELYAAGYPLVAYNNGTPIPYTLGALPANIPDGSQLWICYPYQGYYQLVYLGKAIVRDSYIDPQEFFTVLDADHSLLTFNNNDNFPWLGSANTSPTYVMSDFKGQTGETSFTATITIPKNATAKLKFDWTSNCSGYYAQMAFYINDEFKKSITGDWYGPGTSNFWNYPDGQTNSYDLSGGAAGTKYTFKWVYSQSVSDSYYQEAGYVKNIVITDMVLPPATLTSIVIKTPATKLNYTVGDKLVDITGLEVIGTYSDGSTKKETITAANITGFNSAVAATDQVLTITVGDKTTTYKVQIAAKTGDECFIATAAFGSKFTWPVALLRHFRDQYLLTNRFGRAFVKFYYHNSPPIANYIAGNEGLKGLTRVLLAPFIAIVYLIYHPALALALVLICLAGVIVRRRMATV